MRPCGNGARGGMQRVAARRYGRNVADGDEGDPLLVLRTRNLPGPVNRREVTVARLISVAAVIVATLGSGAAHAADAALIEAAKKEGEVIWYSTQIISQLVRP